MSTTEQAVKTEGEMLPPPPVLKRANAETPKKKKNKRKSVAPAWMSKDGADFSTIKKVDENDQVYFDVTKEDGKYSVWTPRTIRRVLNAASRDPGMRSSGASPKKRRKDNELTVTFLGNDGKTKHKVFIQGRNGSRRAGVDIQRGVDSLNTITKMVADTAPDFKPNLATVRDLGYGSRKAAKILQTWSEADQPAP
jgi:hypothetical protein